MKLSRAATLKFLDDAIERLKIAHTLKLVAMAEAAILHEQEWQVEFGAKWDKVLATCIEARKQQGIITYEMLTPIMDGYYNKIRTFEIKDVIDFIPPHDLIGMKALVQASLDDVIDIKTLSGSDVREIFRKYGQ